MTELERWAPILGRLRGEQVGKVVAWLDGMIERLLTWGLMGTEQRLHILERLMELQEGPISTNRSLGQAIEQQLDGQSRILSIVMVNSIKGYACLVN